MNKILRKIADLITWKWYEDYLDSLHMKPCGCGDGVRTKCDYTCKCKKCHKR